MADLLPEILIFRLLNIVWWLIYHRALRSLLRRLKQAEAELSVERTYSTAVRPKVHELIVNSEKLMANNERLSQIAEKKNELFDQTLSLLDRALNKLGDQEPIVERYNELVQLRQRLHDN